MATIKFVQAQKFNLAGSGASIGDTTITLQSMLGIDGTAITTTDIGLAGFGTLEPGNGTQEEQISFTGITQNANGTATLTGVKTVLFISPYTATSGLAKTHAGATTFILSNDAGFYGQILDYVDQAVSSSGIPATNLVMGISKLSTPASAAANPIVVGDNDIRISQYTVDTGTANTYVIAPFPPITTYASGQAFRFKVLNSNTSSATTLNVNGLGTKPIKKFGANALASGDILANQIVSTQYDGTNFQVLSQTQPVSNPNVPAWVDEGTLTWATENTSKTLTLSTTYDVIKIVASFSVYNTITLRLNGVTTGNYSFREVQAANTIAVSTSATAATLSHAQTSNYGGIMEITITGRHSNGGKSFVCNIANNDDLASRQMLTGLLSSNSADLSTVTFFVPDAAAWVGKAHFYGLNL